MSIVQSKLDGTMLTLSLSGRVDSSNANAVEKDIMDAVGVNAPENVVVDMENLDYISSAGLRIMLRLRKKYTELKLVNVNPEVYEILDMTGFTEMLIVEKAYRKLSVDGCEVIGQGANGKVYRLDADTVVKVYFNKDALPEIHRERELARKAFVLGIPTAIPYDVARVGDSYGSVFELLNASSFAKLMAQEPENLDHYIDLYVDLMKLIHNTETKKGEMPDMKAVALDWAKFLLDYLPEDQGKKLVALVEAVPERNTIIHGDYHVKNVEMQNGEVLLIDMDTLSLGHPVFEFASVYQAYQGFSELDHSVTLNFLGLPYEVCTKIWNETVRRYLGTDDEAQIQAVKDKSMIVGYARLMRRTIRRNGLNTESGRAQIDCCKQHLAELLSRVDSLDF